jgi:hypothetical protein
MTLKNSEFYFSFIERTESLIKTIPEKSYQDQNETQLATVTPLCVLAGSEGADHFST